MNSIGVIGFGNMGEALVDGVRRKNTGLTIRVFDVVPEKVEKAENCYQAKGCTTATELSSLSDITIIAVKPQFLPELFASAGFATGDGKKRNLISLVAGKPISLFRQTLGTDQVIRFMPNIAATVGRALVGG